MTSRVVTALVAVAALLSGGVVAARFTASTTVRPTVNVALPTIPAPRNVSCSWSGALVPVSTLTWQRPDPALSPEPAWYRVYLQRNDNEPQLLVEVAGNSGGSGNYSVSMTQGLLTGLIANLLDLLLGGDVVTIHVNSVYGAYESSAPPTYQLVHHLLPLGAVCAPYESGARMAPPTTTTTTTTTTATSTSTSTSTTAEPTTSTAPATTSPSPVTTPASEPPLAPPPTAAPTATTVAPTTTAASTTVGTTTTTASPEAATTPPVAAGEVTGGDEP
ncbi:hypothetical protein [Desertimonas flava]|uniref:hypothetical protein n=1 Tax=Desertimonas flava TaxID=2064846 RepID=UPI000E34C81B|nr:hypothetical protein [Desertimonas flava]